MLLVMCLGEVQSVYIVVNLKYGTLPCCAEGKRAAFSVSCDASYDQSSARCSIDLLKALRGS